MCRHEMRKTRVAAAAIAAAVGLACAGVAVAAPPGSLPFGAYDPAGDYRDDEDLVIEHLFLPWEDVYLPSLLDADTYARERNRALLVTLEPWTWTRDERNTPEALREGIRSGAYDANMAAVCNVLAALRSPVTLRWAHEMEVKDGQFIWSGWNPADYVEAFRHMTSLCRSIAPAIRVMWSPGGEEGLEAYYPGDDVVDLIGISVFGLQAQDRFKVGRDRSFVDILGPRYQRVAGFGKPVVVAEYGVSGSRDYVDAWDGAVRQVGAQFPNLVGAVHFNQKEVYAWPDGFGLPDWRLDYRVTDSPD
ncbi:glycoside hydrolase family 26 protein [Rhodobacter sp. CZR27]|uniref:glycoside hydrolase family 26 protein n=1 Tax=Rhodobacter sp. CZR27 TaxID=2033869 RepID=UPI001E2CC0EF|nr:glycosyl hydrolase [Rhodobacter sp. CZR27]